MKSLLYVADARRLGAHAALCVALCAGPLFSSAWAATGTGTGASDTSLAEIVVTAEKRDSTVQATAISLTALSGQDLINQNVVTINDIVDKVPGISLRTAGPGQTELEMRGLSSSGGNSATVGFYIDEVPLSASAVALNGRTVIDPDLFDLNHVEALRGPQGTLYGAGSMGGTLKLVTNQPKLGAFEGATAANLSETTHGGTNGGGSLMLNLPMGEIAALRLVGTAKYVSGFVDRIVIQPGQFPAPTLPAGSTGTSPLCAYYCQRGDVANAPVLKDIKGSNQERFASARATLLVKPSHNLSITGALMYQRIDADGYTNYQEQPGGLAIYQPYDQPEPYYDSFKLASLKIEYGFEAATLTSATAYWKRYVFQSTDSTEALQNINDVTHLVNGVYVANYIQNLYVETDPTTQFSEELRLTSKGDSAFQWVSGLYFADLKSGYITSNQATAYATAIRCNSAPPLAGTCPDGNVGPINSVKHYPDPSLQDYPSPQAANPNGVIFNDNNPNVLKQSAVFGEGSYKFTDSLKATAGLRYFHYTNDNHADQAGLGTASVNGDHTILTESTSGSFVLPKLNLSYTPSPDLNVYATVAKGSRPGGFNLPIPLPSAAVLKLNSTAYNCGVGPVHVSAQPDYSPDSVWSFEVGEKAKFADRRFTVNADVYYIKWTDIQQVLSLTCGYPYNTNAGNARSYGPELELAAVVVPGLTVSFSGTFNTAEINQPTATAIASGISPGTRVLNVPRYTAVTSVDYQTALTETLTGSLYISESMTGNTRDQAAYPQVLPSHNFLDARAGISGGAWSAYLVGTNLTNKIAALTIDNTIFAWQTYAITRVSTNQPRTIGVDFQYKF